MAYLFGFADATHGFDGPLPVQVVNFGLLCCSCFRRWLAVQVFDLINAQYASEGLRQSKSC